MSENVAPLSTRRVTRFFNTRRLTLQASALEALMNVLSREEHQEEVLKTIVENLQQQNNGKGIVSVEMLQDVVRDLSRNSKDVNDEALQLLNAFETPRLCFDSMRKQFKLEVDEKRSIFGEATDKVDMFAQRFSLIQQRILRQDLFRPKLVSADGRQASSDDRNVTHTLTPIESLLGRTGVKFMLGMITPQVEEGQYYLEDDTAQVALDVSEAQVVTDGFLAENCVMLVEGEMMEGPRGSVLHVHRMGNPIIETRSEAIDAIGLTSTDIFQSISTLGELEDVRQEEIAHGPDGLFCILSNVHLDKPLVMDKLRTLFEGFQDADPVFVLMGNFLSSGGANSSKELMTYFDELAGIISSIDGLAENGRFIFVPGPQDAGLGDILPRPPLPNYCTASLRSKLQHATFCSNPCRIRYFSKELVFYRNNITSHLQRNALVKPREESNVVQHACKTLLDQGHLCPWPQQAIYWQFDHALRLYPLPDALICADGVVPEFYENYAECDIVNPGPFSNDFSFVVYRPIAEVDGEDETKSSVEFSQV